MEQNEVLTFGRYLKDKYLTKVYKVPISVSGFTCPNIDGTKAKGGCTFCDNDSFSPNIGKNKNKFFLNPQTKHNEIIEEQLSQIRVQFDRTSRLLKDKYKAKKFIVYFQSFTNTYAPIDTLKKLYDEALGLDDVVGISIGTRADSVNDEVLELLQDYRDKTELWIEYGVQSIYDKTLQKINRGESLEVVKHMVKKSVDMGFNVCGHLIFGLPGESKEMMINTYKEVIDWGVKSVKFHPCYVVTNTALAKEFKNGTFSTITKESYTDILIECLKNLPKDVSVQRISAGIGDSSLLSPSWCAKKSSFLKYARKKMFDENIIY
jgi:radical SAM protein (TIGR01212 family)